MAARPWKTGDIGLYGSGLQLVLTPESPRRRTLVVRSFENGMEHRVFAHDLKRPTKRTLQAAQRHVEKATRLLQQWWGHIDIELSRR